MRQCNYCDKNAVWVNMHSTEPMYLCNEHAIVKAKEIADLCGDEDCDPKDWFSLYVDVPDHYSSLAWSVTEQKIV